MITPLPEPVDRVWAVWRGEREYLPTWSDYYTTDQLRDYGEAEYKRGLADAAIECTAVHANGNRKYSHADECAEAIRKLGVLT